MTERKAVTKQMAKRYALESADVVYERPEGP
jgi:hypothetical protein